MRKILIVSKPLSPPWNDSGKNLARDLILAGSRYHYHAMVPPGAPPLGPSSTLEEIYQPLEAGFSLSLAQKARVMLRMIRGREDLFHFFFAPNPASSSAAKLASFLRQAPTIQTICSAPKEGTNVAPWLFGEKIIVLSKATQERLLREGVSARRLTYIPPGICLPEAPSEARIQQVRESLRAGARPIVLFPGDYEVSSAAKTFARAIPLIRQDSDPKPLFVFACRTKTEHAQREEQAIGAMLGQHQDSVRFVGEVRDIYALLAASSIVTLPAESLYAKMDAPLVLLEAMSFGVPIVIANTAPLSELLEGDCGLGVRPQDAEELASAISTLLLGVRPQDAEELASAISTLLQDPARRAKLGEAGRRRVQTFYSADAMARAYESLYDEVLSSRTK